MMGINPLVQLLAFIVCACSLSANAQNSAFPVPNAYYDVYNKALSNDGKWLFFIRANDQQPAQGVLMNLSTRSETVFLDPVKFELNDSYFLILQSDNNLFIKDLRNNSDKQFSETTDFELRSDQNTITIIQKYGKVRWIDKCAGTEKNFSDVEQVHNVEGTPFTLISDSSMVHLLNKNTGAVSGIRSDGRSLHASAADGKNKTLKLMWKDRFGYWISEVHYSGKNRSVARHLQNAEKYAMVSFLDSNTVLGTGSLKNDLGIPKDTVEVWSSRDAILKPQLMNRYEHAQIIDVHDLTGKYKSEKRNNFALDSYLIFNNDYWLELLPLENYTYEINDVAPRPKLRLRNRRSEEVEMEVQETQAVYPSLKGRYLLFFTERNWNIYHADTRSTVNISAKVPDIFYQYDRLNKKVADPVDLPWFSSDYRFIYLTAKTGIWKYDTRYHKISKITPKAEKIVYKIIEPSTGYGVQYMKWNNNPVLKDPCIYVKMMDTEIELYQGLAIVTNDKFKIIEKLSMHGIDEITRSKNAVSYIKQNANLAPQLICYQVTTNSKNICYEEPLLPVNFPVTEVLAWTNAKGKNSYAAVVLPPDYSPVKKYPAIVRIYENEAKRFLNFEPPSYRSPSGFNRTLLAMNGYIVILVRITYAENNVGKSATEAVEEAIKEVQSKYAVDLSNVGLIGHSFGGYETNYILTASNMFKAAVSGSGLADIVSDYFTVHKNFRYSNISRYVNQQFGFTAGFYDLKEQYLTNNPVLWADRIQTPLLLWSGKNDQHVEWRQSVEMFMALASLKKEVRLLLFPDDAHVLSRPVNQVEATKRILEWFNYYLKNGEKPQWF